MKSNLQFNFVIDKENNSVMVIREFNATLDLVWEAWTNPVILDQWWAPKPFMTKTKSMNFSVGGSWLYAMVGPDNEVHWCKNDYHTIDAKKSYSGLDAFCNEEGHIKEDFPRTIWDNNFTNTGETTLVTIHAKYNSLAELEQIISLGFKEGFTLALGNLDEYLEAKFKLKTEARKTNKARVSTYLNFSGNAEEAFLFYQSVFKTEFVNGISRFGNIPQEPNQPAIAEELKDLVLHVELPIVGGHILMGTDAPKEMKFTVTQGNNMHINLEPESKEETSRLFEALAEGGSITMPIQDMFWGAYYGTLTDKFGINWMLNYNSNPN